MKDIKDLIIVPGEREFVPQFEKKPSGVVIVGGQEVAHTVQCRHCAGHFVSIRGSGTRRGYCLNCRGVTCGKPVCDPCIPFEAKLEYVEKQNDNLIKRLAQRFPGLRGVESL